MGFQLKESTKYTSISMTDMRPGQYAVITEGIYRGRIVLCTYISSSTKNTMVYVDLFNPKTGCFTTENGSDWCVRLIDPKDIEYVQ